MNKIIDALESTQLRTLPPFRIGDQVRASLRIIEGESERTQVFEGTVISLRGHGLSETVTLRKVSFGVGVERTLPIHSPRIEKVEVVRSGHVRRAKLYFLRRRAGKEARLDEIVDRSAKAAATGQATAPAAASAAAK